MNLSLHLNNAICSVAWQFASQDWNCRVFCQVEGESFRPVLLRNKVLSFSKYGASCHLELFVVVHRRCQFGIQFSVFSPSSGEVVRGNQADGARLDVSAIGFWRPSMKKSLSNWAGRVDFIHPQNQQHLTTTINSGSSEISRDPTITVHCPSCASSLHPTSRYNLSEYNPFVCFIITPT